MSPIGNEKVLRTSNEMPYPEKEYLSRSGFLVNLISPNKEFLNLKSASFTKLAISALVANFAYANLAAKLSAVELLNSCIVIYLS